VRSQQGRDLESDQEHSINPSQARFTQAARLRHPPAPRSDLLYSRHPRGKPVTAPRGNRAVDIDERINNTTVSRPPYGGNARKRLSLLEWWPGAECDSAGNALINNEVCGVIRRYLPPELPPKVG